MSSSSVLSALTGSGFKGSGRIRSFPGPAIWNPWRYQGLNFCMQSRYSITQHLCSSCSQLNWLAGSKVTLHYLKLSYLICKVIIRLKQQEFVEAFWHTTTLVHSARPRSAAIKIWSTWKEAQIAFQHFTWWNQNTSSGYYALTSCNSILPCPGRNMAKTFKGFQQYWERGRIITFIFKLESWEMGRQIGGGDTASCIYHPCYYIRWIRAVFKTVHETSESQFLGIL